MKSLTRRLVCSGLAFATLLVPGALASGVPPASPQVANGASSTAVPQIPNASQLQPAELARLLRRHDQLLILQVGPRSFFDQAHVAGAEYVGAAGSIAGLEALRQRLRLVDRKQVLVLYCGCCPWDRCPNIRPAFAEARALGFQHVRALYLADNFGADWVDKGYPTAR